MVSKTRLTTILIEVSVRSKHRVPLAIPLLLLLLWYTWHCVLFTTNIFYDRTNYLTHIHYFFIIIKAMTKQLHRTFSIFIEWKFWTLLRQYHYVYSIYKCTMNILWILSSLIGPSSCDGVVYCDEFEDLEKDILFATILSMLVSSSLSV